MSESSLQGFEAKPLTSLNREIMVKRKKSGVECRDDHGEWCISSIVRALSFSTFELKDCSNCYILQRQIWRSEVLGG
jgi:hypothetical protein